MLTNNQKSALEQILELRDLSKPLYMLLDPLNPVYEVDPISISSLKTSLGKDAVIPVLRADLSHTPEVCPQLIKLANAGVDLSAKADAQSATSTARQVLEYAVNFSRDEYPGSRRYVCGWLQADLDLQALVVYLADKMMLEWNEAPRFYPVYEPLRQELIAQACEHVDPQLHSQWLGDISSWIIPSSNQFFLHYTGQPGASVPLHVNAVAAQIDSPAVAHVLAVWREQTVEPLTPDQLAEQPLLTRGKYALPQGAAYQALMQIRAASQYGLSNPHDLVLFSILRLTVHPRFNRHPVVQNAIAAAVRDATPLAVSLNNIGHVQWLQMIDDIDSYI